MEDVLHRHQLRPVAEQLAREPVVHSAKAVLDGAGPRDLQDAVGEVAKAGPTRVLDDAEPAVPRTRIDPQDSHSTRDSIAAISSSEISKLA